MIKNREEQPAPRLSNIARQYGLEAMDPGLFKAVVDEAFKAAREARPVGKTKAAKKPAKKAGKRRMAR